MQQEKIDPKSDPKNTGLAEGERQTVGESIREHERRGDQQGRPAPKKK